MEIIHISTNVCSFHLHRTNTNALNLRNVMNLINLMNLMNLMNLINLMNVMNFSSWVKFLLATTSSVIFIY